MSWMLCALLMLAGLVMVGAGVVLSCDPEGRGAAWVWCVPAGAVVALVALVLIVVRFAGWL